MSNGSTSDRSGVRPGPEAEAEVVCCLTYVFGHILGRTLKGGGCTKALLAHFLKTYVGYTKHTQRQHTRQKTLKGLSVVTDFYRLL